MMGMYVLEGQRAVPEPDLIKWGQFMQSEKRTVKKSTAKIKLGGLAIGEVVISTVFLGLDHSFNNGGPLLFETMVFGGIMDQEQDRCGTWEAAEKMHELMCERVKTAYKELNNDVGF